MRWLPALLGTLLVLALWTGPWWSWLEPPGPALVPDTAPEVRDALAAAEASAPAGSRAPSAALVPGAPIVLAGRVVDAQACERAEEGLSAAGLDLVLSRASLMGLAGDGGELRVRTDEQGRFRFEVRDARGRPARWNLRVEGSAKLRAGATTTLEIEL